MNLLDGDMAGLYIIGSAATCSYLPPPSFTENEDNDGQMHD